MYFYNMTWVKYIHCIPFGVSFFTSNPHRKDFHGWWKINSKSWTDNKEGFPTPLSLLNTLLKSHELRASFVSILPEKEEKTALIYLILRSLFKYNSRHLIVNGIEGIAENARVPTLDKICSDLGNQMLSINYGPLKLFSSPSLLHTSIQWLHGCFEICLQKQPKCQDYLVYASRLCG